MKCPAPESIKIFVSQYNTDIQFQVAEASLNHWQLVIIHLNFDGPVDRTIRIIGLVKHTLFPSTHLWIQCRSKELLIFSWKRIIKDRNKTNEVHFENLKPKGSWQCHSMSLSWIHQLNINELK